MLSALDDDCLIRTGSWIQYHLSPMPFNCSSISDDGVEHDDEVHHDDELAARMMTTLMGRLHLLRRAGLS